MERRRETSMIDTKSAASEEVHRRLVLVRQSERVCPPYVVGEAHHRAGA
jgi:hypothetical protein